MKFKARFDKRVVGFIADKLEELQTPVKQADAVVLGRECLSEMKSLISKGVSPIAGKGRFPAYKNPSKYPGNLKSKSPVNLSLTGKMLDDLDFKVVKAATGFAPSVGYSSQKEQVKERGHREGANGQPSRPTIPQGSSGETFAISIQNVYLKVLNSVINRVARRKQ